MPNKTAFFSSAVVVTAGLLLLPLTAFAVGAAPASAPQTGLASVDASATMPAGHTHLLGQYCSGCHNDKLHIANMSIQGLRESDLANGTNMDTWEKILRRLSLGEMPPKGMPRPSSADLKLFTGSLEASLDAYAAGHPNPGHATLRRLNRAEYANAVRDLLDINIDVSTQLPADDSGYGFDNIADVLTVSPTLMDRYMAVAGKVARLATGLSSTKPFVTQHVLTKDLNVLYHGLPSYKERASTDLPVDSRGGGLFHYYAPFTANYDVQAVLNSNTFVDNDIRKENTYGLRLPLKAGAHVIGAYFAKSMALDETTQKIFSGAGGVIVPQGPPPQYQLNFEVDGAPVHSVMVPAYAYPLTKDYFQQNFLRDVLEFMVTGPYDVKGPGATPSRRRIFICHPAAGAPDAACARRILTNLASQAYRRPATADDMATLMQVYETRRKGSDFEHGIEGAVEAILVSPQFLFMEEKTPVGAPGSVHRISDLELATRLSFFLWSSLPDKALVTVAQRGQLHQPAILKQQVVRMLADPKADALVQNFAGQWLYLRNLDYQRPDIETFPSFDERLRSAMLTETQMFVMSVFRDNASVLNFIKSDYTFLNQRLAEHYGIPGVSGTAFRKVMLTPDEHRGGLLGQGAILTVTSPNNRTSIVRRGKWILDNILAAPPPPPPPSVPAFPENTVGKMTVRQQMELHRTNPVCASCHSKIDPLGFALENYDAIGAWRTKDAGQALDVSAVLPAGTQFNGPDGLQDVLVARKDQFVEAFIERLMTYALGRGLEAYDMPAVRIIRRAAARDDYRADAIFEGIVESVPFQMRQVPQQVKRTALK